MASVKSRLSKGSPGADTEPDQDAVGDGSARRRRLVVPAAITALIVVAVIVAVIASSSGKSSGAQSGAIQGSATAKVERRELIETDTQTGTLGYRDTRNVYN